MTALPTSVNAPVGNGAKPAVVLEIEGLQVRYGDDARAVHAVNGVDLALRRGEVLGLAGESGSGKSTLANAVTRLLRPSAEVTGRVLYHPPAAGVGPVDVLTLDRESLRRFRWREVAVVFQAAMSALNPVLTIRTQLIDGLAAHRPELSKRARLDRARELIDLVKIDPDRLSAYPHQLSGGQRQRVMIAMALALEPEILILDEPTTALDVVVQRDIILSLMELRERIGCSMIFITHDLSLLAEMADTIAVMYAGRIVEKAPAEILCSAPTHPYTAGLLSSFPSLRGPRRVLKGIEGSPPDLSNLPPGCPFHPRCPEAVPECAEREPLLRNYGEDRRAACLVREATLLPPLRIPAPRGREQV
jgi:peptide/nickel transport system ATP-binding protein